MSRIGTKDWSEILYSQETKTSIMQFNVNSTECYQGKNVKSIHTNLLSFHVLAMHIFELLQCNIIFLNLLPNRDIYNHITGYITAYAKPLL